MFSIFLQLMGIYGIIDIVIKVIALCTHNSYNSVWLNAIKYVCQNIPILRQNTYDPATDESFFDNFWGIANALYSTEIEKMKLLSNNNYQVQGSTEYSGLPVVWFAVPINDPCEREKMAKIGANTLRNHLAAHGVTSPVLADWRQDVNGLPLLCLRYAITPEQRETIDHTQKSACDATIRDLNGRPTFGDLLL